MVFTRSPWLNHLSFNRGGHRLRVSERLGHSELAQNAGPMPAPLTVASEADQMQHDTTERVPGQPQLQPHVQIGRHAGCSSITLPNRGIALQEYVRVFNGRRCTARRYTKVAVPRRLML